MADSFIEYLITQGMIEEVMALVDLMKSEEKMIRVQAKNDFDEIHMEYMKEIGSGAMRPLEAVNEIMEYRSGNWKSDPREFLA